MRYSSDSFLLQATRKQQTLEIATALTIGANTSISRASYSKTSSLDRATLPSVSTQDNGGRGKLKPLKQHMLPNRTAALGTGKRGTPQHLLQEMRIIHGLQALRNGTRAALVSQIHAG